MIYLDWAAGAPLHPLAKEAVARALELGPGNPSSVHAGGRSARALLEKAREQVASLVGCDPREVIFTGSATEANAAAILGVARSSPGARLVIGSVEHPSIRLAGAEAARSGSTVVEAAADSSGVVGVEAVREAVAEERASLIAVQLANNETGVRHPVEGISLVAREAGALFHCDAVQAAGKIPLADVWNRSDSLSLSAHKIGGLPGVGALVMRRALDLPVLIPGHQERGLRGGTPALPAIAAFGAMAEYVGAGLSGRHQALADRSAALERVLRGAFPSVRINGAGAERVPGVVNATFPGIDGETLLVMLDLAGVACSHGAACSTGAMEPSHVLLAMGLGKEDARSTVRFSVGPETTFDEIQALAELLPSALRSSLLG